MVIFGLLFLLVGLVIGIPVPFAFHRDVFLIDRGLRTYFYGSVCR